MNFEGSIAIKAPPEKVWELLLDIDRFSACVPGVEEVSIGHALIADALELGLGEAVRVYLRCIHLAHAPVPAMRG